MTAPVFGQTVKVVHGANADKISVGVITNVDSATQVDVLRHGAPDNAMHSNLLYVEAAGTPPGGNTNYCQELA